MFVILNHDGFERGAAMSALFVLQSLLALALVHRWVHARFWTVVAWLGALVLIRVGSGAIINNLSSSHFEGYAFLMGFLLTLQGLLTLLTPSSKVHQFGN